MELKKEESSWSRQEGEVARALPTGHKVAMSPYTGLGIFAASGHHTRGRFILIILFNKRIM